MHRINTPADVVATGLVQVDAGQGVTLEVPLMPGGGGVSPDDPALYRSGLRNVAADLATGWAPSTQGVRMSRQGATVTIALDVTRVGDLASNFADVLAIPEGFRPIMSGYIQPAKSAALGGEFPNPSVSGWWDRLNTTAPLRFRDMPTGERFKDGQRLTNVISWQTIDPIPTSLPGIPI